VAASESRVPNLYAEALVDSRVQRQGMSRELFRRAMLALELAADFLTFVAAALGAYFLQLYFGAQVQ
jgi:hypothetical protein